jgi:fibronectin type 3 domain-containing protein
MFQSPITHNPIRVVLLLATAIFMCAPAPAGQAHDATSVNMSLAAAQADPTLGAVGDMGCAATNPKYNGGNGTATSCRQKYVSDLLVNPIPSAVLLLGDNQYVRGELSNFQAVYHPTFGRTNAVAYPSIGNAEYDTPGAQGWFDYYSSVGVTARIAGSGADASNYANGYYSFDVGAWHLIALNSNCSDIAGGCKAGGAQETWLKSDLAAHPNQCTLAYWHHPRWNSGSLGNDSSTAAFWTDLYNAHADIVLNGHGNHHYERHTPQTPAGVPNPSAGIREFIVSTGGEEHGTPPGTPGDPNTLEVSDYTSFGVIRMALHPTSYDWQFVPEVGGSFTDSGSGTCHSAPASQAPGAPALSATADSAVHLSWSTPSDGGSPITGYRIYRGTSAGGETLLTTAGNVTSYDDASATGGTKYYYRVAAVNSVAEGSQSNEVSATPGASPPPPSPFPGAAVLDDFVRSAGALGASWQSPGLADPGTVAIQSSGVTASGAGASSATWKTTFAADQDAYLTVPVLPKAGQFLQVAGRVSTLSASTVSCYFLRVTPSTSTWDLRKKLGGAGSTSMKTFSAPFTAGDGAGLRIIGSTITAYRKPGGGAWTSVGSTNDTAIPGGGYLSFTLGDTTIRGGAFGGGSVTAPPPAQGPPAPTLSATADSAVHLSWNAPSDGGSPITGYKIYRGTSAGGETLLTSVGTVASYDDPSVTGGTKYYYRVAAVNSIGDGTQSNEVSATPVQLPAAPSLSATADSAVHLSWSAPANGGAPISGYNLYRGTSAGGETLLQGVGNVTSYDDSAVTSGTKYYYRVAAVNSVGESPQSNEVSAAPGAAPPPPLPFPRTPLLDSFARPAGALGTSWQSPGLADPGTVTIVSSGVTKSGSGASSATWSTQTFGPDQEAYLTVPILPSGSNFFQVAGRVSTLSASTVSCYFLRVTPSTGIWDLRKKVNGAGSSSMKTFSATFAAGDSAGLQIIGSTITAYRKPGAGAWTSVGSTTDTAIPGAGFLSFTLGDTTARGGAFGGGKIN